MPDFLPKQHHPSPEAAERAFYQHLEAGDAETLMAQWGTHNILCVHPLGPSLHEAGAVRDSWRLILEAGQGLAFSTELLYQESGETLCVRVVREDIVMGQGAQQKYASMIATNIYRHDAEGWLMIVHHSSPSAPAGQATDSGSSTLLH